MREARPGSCPRPENLSEVVSQRGRLPAPSITKKLRQKHLPSAQSGFSCFKHRALLILDINRVVVELVKQAYKSAKDHHDAELLERVIKYKNRGKKCNEDAQAFI